MAMTDRRGASAPMLVRDGVLALPNVPNVVLLANARVVLWDTAKRRANRLDLGDIRTLVSLLATGPDKQKEDAAAVIANLACDRDNREAMASTDAVVLLVQILRDAQSKSHLGLSMLMLKSTRAIANLTWQNSKTQQQVDECDGVRVLVDLLGGVGRGSVDEELQDEAVTALNHIFDNEAIAAKADASTIGEQLNRLSQRGSETQRGHATWLLAKITCHTMRDTVNPAQLVDFPALVEMLSSESISHSMQATAVLRRLSKDSENKSKIVVAGGVPPLIALLMRGSEKEKVDAAWTLGELAWNAFSESQIANAGAIPPLLALLQSDSVREREAAAWALRHLSGTTENRNRIGASLHGIHNLVNAVRTTDSACERVHAIATLKNLACQSENQSAIAASGGIPVMLSVVKTGTQGSVTEALAALRNLVRLNQINQAQLVAGGGIALMVSVLLTGSETQRVHAVATLANLAASKEAQFEIIAEGVLSSILPLTESDDFVLLEQVLLLIRNLIWANESIQQRIGASGVIPRIVAALKLDVEGCQGVKKQAASALRNLAWHCPGNQRRIEDAHGVVHLLRLLGARAGSGQREHAAGAIANLAWNNERVQEAVAMMKGLAVLTELAARASDKAQSQAKLALRQFVFQDDKKVRRAAPGVVDSLVRLLQSSSHTPSHQQATWMIANVACSADNKEEIVQSGAIRPLVGLLSNGDDRVKQYAASAIANLASSPDHKLQIIEAGSVPPLIELVGKGTDGQKKNAVWALRNMAWSCNDGQSAIAAANGIKPLIGLLGAGNDAQKDHAAAALGNLACNDANQLKIAAAGGIEALIQLVFAGTDSQKQQAVWAIANLALAASNRSRIVECRGIAALEYVLANGTTQQQRGAATALARINDPGRLVHPSPVDSSHAVFRTLSEGSEDILNMPPPHHVELARGGSLQSRASDTHALLSQQSPGEQQVGRALYRSIKSVPTIITRSPTASIESMSPPNRSPTEQHRSDTAQFFKLQSVQEATDFKDDNDRIIIGAPVPPTDTSKSQLRRVQSSVPQKRVAYRMPPSPLEQSRLNRPLLPRPSTLGDLLDPLGGMTPPSNPAKLLRPVSHNKMKNGAAKTNGKSSQQVESTSKPKTSLGLGQQQPPAVDLKDVRTLSLNEQEFGYFGRELIPGKENLPAKGSVLEELFRRSVGVDPGNDDKTSSIPPSHWNDRTTMHQLQARKPSDLSSFGDVYEYDEDELAPPSTSTSSGRSKYPVVTL